jgi:hypothetical protein
VRQVRFALDRAGLVGADGATHSGFADVTYMGVLPNMIIMAVRTPPLHTPACIMSSSLASLMHESGGAQALENPLDASFIPPPCCLPACAALP